MREKSFATEFGVIHYWVQNAFAGKPTLVFLPGLTADHRLFDRQVAYFRDRCNCLVWDAPGHGASTPFRLTFDLKDKARFLHDLLAAEKIDRPVLVGQSMGGYVAQLFIVHYPGEAAGFVSIDSAPLERRYITAAEIWSLRHVEPVYWLYPWKLLRKAGSTGCADSAYGQRLMLEMMDGYTKAQYCRLAGHGFRILADAIAAGVNFAPDCPVALVCGTHDRAGSAKRYNRSWAKTAGFPLHWIADAGHNSNTDQPEAVNRIIEALLKTIEV